MCTFKLTCRILARSFELAPKGCAVCGCAGHGVAADHRLSHALMEAAAARGDPLSQGVQGLQQSLGLHPPNQGSHRSFSFGPTDTPRALLNYYFAASGNDSFSQMVLGYRHAHGLGVPQSCEAAVLYYHPVAEETIALAAVPNSLPLVRAIHRVSQLHCHIRVLKAAAMSTWCPHITARR